MVLMWMRISKRSWVRIGFFSFFFVVVENQFISISEETSNEHARHNGIANESNVFSFPSYFNATNSVLEIPNGKVIFRQRIGEGHYGTVHLGEVRYNSPNNAREYVAIKTLKSARAPQLSYDFMREIEIMEVWRSTTIVCHKL